MIVAGLLFTLLVPPAIYIVRNVFHGICKLEALGVETFILPLGIAAIFTPIPFMFAIVFPPVQRKLAIFDCLTLLRSFEDEGERLGRRNTPSRLQRFLAQSQARRVHHERDSEYTGGGEIQL